MKKLILLLSLSAIAWQPLMAQEEKEEKQMWANSVLNEKAPKLEVEKWLSDEPKMDGKFVLVEFWATWCGPCRKAIPKLNEWNKTFKEDLVVIGISHEKEQTVRDMINPRIEYYSAIDTRALTKTALNVKGIPHVILMNPDGVVIWEGFPLLGGYELTADKIKALIDKYKK